MYEHIYLYDLKSEKPIHIHNNTIEITEEIQSTFEKLLKEAIEDNLNPNVNSNDQIDIKNKFSKFYTLNGTYYTCSTEDLLTSILTTQKNNEKIYQELLNEISSDDNFFIHSDNPDKIEALLDVYLNKFFSKLNPQIENNVLVIKDDNGNIDKSNKDENASMNNSKKNKEYKARKTIFVGEALETQIEELNKIELPRNYTKNKNLKLYLILLFVFVGIILAIILPFVL